MLFCASQRAIADDDSAVSSRMNTAFGPTGLITVPTAYVTPKGEAQIGAFFGRDSDSASVNYGLISGLEVGAAYLSSSDDEIIANVKANIIPSNWDRVQIGVGLMDVLDQVEDTFYAIVSTDLLAPPSALEDDATFLRLHVGYGAGAFDDEIIGGAELFLNSKWAVLAEWNGDELGAAIRYCHDTPFRAQAGMYDERFFASMTVGLEF